MSATLADRMAEAWINRRHRVCGLALDPYCAHHLQLLQVVQSPLIAPPADEPAPAFPATPPRVIDWPALLLACQIARTPYDSPEIRWPSARRHILWVTLRILATALRWATRRARRALRGPARRRRGPAKPRARRIAVSLWPTLAKRLLLIREARRFRAWQNDYQAEPDLFFETAGAELTTPALLARVVFVMRHLHLDERRAWTMPIGKLLWHYAATLEQVGSGVTLLEPRQADENEIIRRIQTGEMEIPPEWAAEIAAAQRESDAWHAAHAPAAARRDGLDLSVFGPA